MGKHDSRYGDLRESATRCLAKQAHGDAKFFADWVVKLVDERNALMDRESGLLGAARSVHDLASARLRNPPLEANVEHDLGEIVRICESVGIQP